MALGKLYNEERLWESMLLQRTVLESGVPPMMATQQVGFTRKGVPFSGFRYMKVYEFHSFNCMKAQGNLSFGL